jgi:hypothetical protein
MQSMTKPLLDEAQARARPRTVGTRSGGRGMIQVCGVARGQRQRPFETADFRLGIRQACILARLQDAGADFGAICLRIGALGLRLSNRPLHPVDYLPNCVRDCPGDCLGESLVRRLPNCLGGHGPEYLVRGLRGSRQYAVDSRQVSCGAGCGHGCLVRCS